MDDKKYDELLGDLERAEGITREETSYDDLNNIGAIPKREDKVLSVLQTLFSNVPTYEITLGVDKAKLLEFVKHSISIPMQAGYRPVAQKELIASVGQSLDTDVMNMFTATYYPSTLEDIYASVGVHNLISILITKDVIHHDEETPTSIVDLAREKVGFGVNKLLEKLDTSKLFNPYIPIPMRKFQNSGAVELFVNTTIVILSYLGLSLKDVERRYTFTVKDIDDQYIVHLKRI